MNFILKNVDIKMKYEKYLKILYWLTEHIMILMTLLKAHKSIFMHNHTYTFYSKLDYLFQLFSQTLFLHIVKHLNFNCIKYICNIF